MTALRASYPYWLAGEAVSANSDLEVTDKYTGRVATRVALADARAIERGSQPPSKPPSRCARWLPTSARRC